MRGSRFPGSLPGNDVRYFIGTSGQAWIRSIQPCSTVVNMTPLQNSVLSGKSSKLHHTITVSLRSVLRRRSSLLKMIMRWFLQRTAKSAVSLSATFSSAALNVIMKANLRKVTSPSCAKTAIIHRTGFPHSIRMIPFLKIISTQRRRQAAVNVRGTTRFANTRKGTCARSVWPILTRLDVANTVLTQVLMCLPSAVKGAVVSAMAIRKPGTYGISHKHDFTVMRKCDFNELRLCVFATLLLCYFTA